VEQLAWLRRQLHDRSNFLYRIYEYLSALRRSLIACNLPLIYSHLDTPAGTVLSQLFYDSDFVQMNAKIPSKNLFNREIRDKLRDFFIDIEYTEGYYTLFYSLYLIERNITPSHDLSSLRIDRY